MFGTVTGKKIAVFGFAFKKDTSDTRESPAISVCSQLGEEGAVLRIFDPRVSRAQILEDLQSTMKCERVEVCESPEEAATHAHAIVITTEWDMFRDLDYGDILSRMNKPAFLFDGRNVLNHAKLVEMGFNVKAIGKSLH
jgi:UDPglucose 6-dehydrogenase